MNVRKIKAENTAGDSERTETMPDYNINDLNWETEFSVENFSEERDSVTSGDAEEEAIIDEMFGAEQWRAAMDDLEAEYHKEVQEALRLVKSAGYTIN